MHQIQPDLSNLHPAFSLILQAFQTDLLLQELPEAAAVVRKAAEAVHMAVEVDRTDHMAAEADRMAAEAVRMAADRVDRTAAELESFLCAA